MAMEFELFLAFSYIYSVCSYCCFEYGKLFFIDTYMWTFWIWRPWTYDWDAVYIGFEFFFAGAMQQYENELFDVFQSNHQNHLYYNVILFLEQNWVLID